MDSSVDIVYLVSTQTDCGAASVHSSISAAYDGNVFAKINGLVANNLAKEINTADHTFRILALAANAVDTHAPIPTQTAS